MKKEFIEKITVNLDTVKYKIHLRNKAVVYITLQQYVDNGIARNDYDPILQARWHGDNYYTADDGTMFYKNAIDSMTVERLKNTHQESFNKYKVTEGTFKKTTEIVYELIS